jgi:hypothetical protein
VSEPVKINWKKGKDITGGLTDAAYKLLQARQKLAKKGDAKIKETTLPEYKILATKIEQSEEASNSFFAWFAFVASYRWISAEESEKAFKAEAERREKINRGEKVEEEEPTEDDEQDYQETEVFPQGDEVATLIAEDVWPSAIQYYSIFPTSLVPYTMLTLSQSARMKQTMRTSQKSTKTLTKETTKVMRKSTSEAS